jgi:hypothetical protein
MRQAAILTVGAALFAVGPVGIGRDRPEAPRLAAVRAEGLVYPGAKRSQESKDAVGGGYTAAYTTPDALDTVAAWYADKLDIGWLPKLHNSYEVHGYQGTAFHRDDWQPGGKTRPVRVAVLSQRAKDYTASVTLSRAAAEEHTHIVLTVWRDPPHN